MMRFDPDEIEVKKQLFMGLDLGQSQDFSALAIIERLLAQETCQFNCIHLQRWPLRTSYPAIVADVVRMINGIEPSRSPDGKTALAIDATGVGAPVVDLFKRERINTDLTPIQIVAGAQVSRENEVTRIPKRDLVSTVQVALQNRTLKIASGLAEAETLIRELQSFTVKITDAGNDIYGEWRTGKHDDLVLAVALSLWTAKESIPTPRVIYEQPNYFSQTSW